MVASTNNALIPQNCKCTSMANIQIWFDLFSKKNNYTNIQINTNENMKIKFDLCLICEKCGRWVPINSLKDVPMSSFYTKTITKIKSLVVQFQQKLTPLSVDPIIIWQLLWIRNENYWRQCHSLFISIKQPAHSVQLIKPEFSSNKASHTS